MSTEVSNIFDIMKSTQRFEGTRHSGDVGVEIETEVDASRRYDYPKMKYWTAKKDGSLRDYGVEYVLKAPMSTAEFNGLALQEFKTADQKFNFRKNSISTSVHVHLNMLNESYLTLANLVTAYALTENLLIKYSGEDRLSNLFCLPMCDAEGTVTQIVNLLTNINKKFFNKASLNSDRVKYAALNLANLHTLGTAEVRSFRGETDTVVIERWVNMLVKLKEFSKRKDLTPPKILQMYKEYGANTLVDLIFQEYSTYLKLGKETDTLVKKNVKYAADFASVSKDWTKFGILKMKPVYKEKIKSALDNLATDKFGSSYDNLPFHERLVISEMYHKANPTTRVVDLEEDI